MRSELAALALVLVACGKDPPIAAPAAPVAPPPPAAAALPEPASPVAALPVAATATAGTELTARGEHFAVTWRFAPPKVGELFAIDVTLTDVNGQPVPGAKLALDATMPAHGHGMMTDPDVKQSNATHWHAEGLKLHMHGAWQFEARVEAAGVKERLTAAYEQAPEATDGL